MAISIVDVADCCNGALYLVDGAPIERNGSIWQRR
jgi:hypothetical protein